MEIPALHETGLFQVRLKQNPFWQVRSSDQYIQISENRRVEAYKELILAFQSTTASGKEAIALSDLSPNTLTEASRIIARFGLFTRDKYPNHLARVVFNYSESMLDEEGHDSIGVDRRTPQTYRKAHFHMLLIDQADILGFPSEKPDEDFLTPIGASVLHDIILAQKITFNELELMDDIGGNQKNLPLSLNFKLKHGWESLNQSSVMLSLVKLEHLYKQTYDTIRKLFTTETDEVTYRAWQRPTLKDPEDIKEAIKIFQQTSGISDRSKDYLFLLADKLKSIRPDTLTLLKKRNQRDPNRQGMIWKALAIGSPSYTLTFGNYDKDVILSLQPILFRSVGSSVVGHDRFGNTYIRRLSNNKPQNFTKISDIILERHKFQDEFVATLPNSMDKAMGIKKAGVEQ